MIEVPSFREALAIMQAREYVLGRIDPSPFLSHAGTSLNTFSKAATNQLKATEFLSKNLVVANSGISAMVRSILLRKLFVRTWFITAGELPEQHQEPAMALVGSRRSSFRSKLSQKLKKWLVKTSNVVVVGQVPETVPVAAEPSTAADDITELHYSANQLNTTYQEELVVVATSSRVASAAGDKSTLTKPALETMHRRNPARFIAKRCGRMIKKLTSLFH